MQRHRNRLQHWYVNVGSVGYLQMDSIGYVDNAQLLTLLRSKSFQCRASCQLRPSDLHTHNPFCDPHRPPYCSTLHPGHVYPSSRCPLSLSFAFPTVPSWNIHTEYLDAGCVPTSLPDRCLTLRPTYGVGFVHRSCGDYPHSCQRHCLVCHAPDSG